MSKSEASLWLSSFGPALTHQPSVPRSYDMFDQVEGPLSPSLFIVMGLVYLGPLLVIRVTIELDLVTLNLTGLLYPVGVAGVSGILST